jgi:hypothetical protein
MATSPVQAMLLQSIISKIAGGGGGGPTPGSPGGPTPLAGAAGAPGGADGVTVASPADGQSDQLSKELSIMRKADPQMMTRELTSVKQHIVTLINHSAMSLPAVARGLSKTLQGIDAALKAAGEAATTMATVAGGPSDSQSGVSGPPLGTSALPPGLGSGAGQPGMAS